MANYRAIAAVAKAVIHFLESQYTPADFDGNQLEFKVYLAKDFEQPMAAGVSLFLYRVLPNNSHRTPAGRITPTGQRHKTQLPVDLHFLLTAWGKDASLQHTITGWVMRMMEDTPIFPSGLLNTVAPDVFASDETVEVYPAELKTEDLLHVWETLPKSDYQLSIPYVARSVQIESTALLTAGEPVQERSFDYREFTDKPESS